MRNLDVDDVLVGKRMAYEAGLAPPPPNHGGGTGLYTLVSHRRPHRGTNFHRDEQESKQTRKDSRKRSRSSARRPRVRRHQNTPPVYIPKAFAHSPPSMRSWPQATHFHSFHRSFPRVCAFRPAPTATHSLPWDEHNSLPATLPNEHDDTGSRGYSVCVSSACVRMVQENRNEKSCTGDTTCFFFLLSPPSFFFLV